MADKLNTGVIVFLWIVLAFVAGISGDFNNHKTKYNELKFFSIPFCFMTSEREVRITSLHQ